MAVRSRGSNHFLNDAGRLDAGQPVIESLVTKSEPLVIDAEQVQTFTSLDALMVELRGLGIKRVEVQL